MWRWIVLALIAMSIVVFGFSLIDSTAGDTVNASTEFSSIPDDTSLYKRAVDAWNWEFPKDFGAHPEFQTEWWYYTGNVQDADGRRFGYQFTIFRRAILPESFDTTSEWRTDQVYMAHFAVSDIAGGQYYHEQRFSRGGADLAGATADPLYHVWLEDWQIIAQDDQAAQTRITASTEKFAVDLNLEQTKPPALQGQNGLSPKSAEPGNASYYYSLSRLLTEGTIRVVDQTFTVTGTTWKDHEFSTSALGANALGWDWFGLQLDDERELMLGQIRLIDGGREPAFGGLLVYPDGTTRYLKSTDFTFEVTNTWQSPHTGAAYPAGWNITIDTGDDDPLNLTVTPLLADQELHGSGGTDYWEGAVQIGGDVTGYGYAELTGYVQAMTGRF